MRLAGSRDRLKPNWTIEGKASPFKRNDRMLDAADRAGVFKGCGIIGNLADKTRKLGVPVAISGRRRVSVSPTGR